MRMTYCPVGGEPLQLRVYGEFRTAECKEHFIHSIDVDHQDSISRETCPTWTAYSPIDTCTNCGGKLWPEQDGLSVSAYCEDCCLVFECRPREWEIVSYIEKTHQRYKLEEVIESSRQEGDLDMTMLHEHVTFPHLYRCIPGVLCVLPTNKAPA